jgi:hypothetical protein
VREDSPAAKLDNALQANPKYGAGFYDLPHDAQQLAKADPSLAPLFAAKEQALRQKGGYTGAAQAVQDARDAAETAAAPLAQSDPAKYRQQMSQIAQDKRTRLDQTRADFNQPPLGQGPPPVEPNALALWQYYKMLDGSAKGTPDGKPDYNAFDASLASAQKVWTPTQNAYVKAQTGAAYHADPTAQRYEQDMQTIRDSNYYDIKKQLTAATVAQARIPGADPNNLKDSLTKALTPQYGTQAPLAASVVMGKIDASVAKQMEAWRLNPKNAAAAALIYKWGIAGGAREQAVAGVGQ